MYGLGTRSYNRSTEARENKRAQKEATERYLQASAKGEIKPIMAPLLCRCRSWEFPHEIEQHRQLRSEFDWPTPQERLARTANQEFWERPL